MLSHANLANGCFNHQSVVFGDKDEGEERNVDDEDISMNDEELNEVIAGGDQYLSADRRGARELGYHGLARPGQKRPVE